MMIIWSYHDHDHRALPSFPICISWINIEPLYMLKCQEWLWTGFDGVHATGKSKLLRTANVVPLAILLLHLLHAVDVGVGGVDGIAGAKPEEGMVISMVIKMQRWCSAGQFRIIIIIITITNWCRKVSYWSQPTQRCRRWRCRSILITRKKISFNVQRCRSNLFDKIQ